MERFQLGIEGEARVYWEIDAERMVARDHNGLGLTVPLRPFMGVLGNAPAAAGPHATAPPRAVGGNIDCRELIPGSILWLPVEVEGALFSVGDGHAAQGDGEVSGTAIECPMERVELTFQLHKSAHFSAPCAETPAGYLTFGFGDTLDDATGVALNQMLDHLQRTCSLDRPTALALASLVVDLRITQIVNGVMGVHAVLPPSAFAQSI
jgi:acetamidase/formamidase